MLKNTVANLAYPATLISIYAHCFLTAQEFELLIIEDCTDDVRQVLIKAGLNQLALELKDGNLCQYPFPEMENLFLTEYVRQAVKIVRSFSGAEHDFFLYWLRQDEICNIKTILRGKSAHRSRENIRSQLYDLGPFASLSLDDLLHSEDVPEVLHLLEKSYYSSMAHYTLMYYEQQKDIFSLETSVEQQFYVGLQRRLNMINETDRLQLQPLLGRYIDQVNLVRLLRFRFNYDLSPSHTYFLLSSGGYHLHQQHLLKLVKTRDMEEVMTILPPALVKLLNEAKSIQMIHTLMENDLIDYALQFLKSNSFTFSSVFAYLMAKKHQLLRIRAILKGKAIKADTDTIRFAIGMN